MRLRSLALLGALASTCAPSVSQAEDVCDSPVSIFTRYRVAETGIEDPRNPNDTLGTAPAVNSSVIGCTVIRDIAQPGSGFEYFYDTNLIYPGSNRIEVRLLEHGRDPSVLSEATLTVGEDVYQLDMKPATFASGAVAPWMDSAPIDIDPAVTLGPLLISAHLCLDGGTEDDICHDVTYRTLPLQPLPA